MEKRQHSISKLLRMTPEEAKLLEEKAKQAGMTESQYLRLMISQKPNDYPEVRQLLRDLINEVNRIGVNINQITHNHNAELYSKDDKERLIAYMRKLNVAVAKVVDIVGNQYDSLYEGLRQPFSRQALKTVFALCNESGEDAEWEADRRDELSAGYSLQTDDGYQESVWQGG